MKQVLMVALAAVALSGCQWMKPKADVPAEPSPVPAAEEAMKGPDAAAGKVVDGVLSVFAENNGGAVTLKKGETLFIELKSIPTAGYVWEAKTLPAFLEAGATPTRPTDPERQNQPGFTGGNHYLGFYYKAIATGTGKIEMIEGRPWETDEPPIGEWSIDVTVVE